MPARLPKAELHCHIEGAASPDLVLRQAQRHGVDVSAVVQDGRFVWHDFSSFLQAYDLAASVFRTEEDFARLAEDYLSSIARDGAIYAEFFVSPDHGRSSGLGEKSYLAGLAEGIRRANAKTGIEARMIVVGLRHLGAEAVEAAARFAARCGNPLVTGFGMAGEERVGDVEDYQRAFELAREAGLGITVHAGELAGADSVRAALDHLKPQRIGHGVRAIEDVSLVRRIAADGVVLECCPGSNVALGVFPSWAEHPLPRLKDAGCKVTLSSDDPPYFDTSLEREYAAASRYWDFDTKTLVGLTRTAIEAAFCDRKTKTALLAKLPAGR